MPAPAHGPKPEDVVPVEYVDDVDDVEEVENTLEDDRDNDEHGDDDGDEDNNEDESETYDGDDYENPMDQFMQLLVTPEGVPLVCLVQDLVDTAREQNRVLDKLVKVIHSFKPSKS